MLIRSPLTFTIFYFILVSVHRSIHTIQRAKFLRKYKKRSYDNSIFASLRDTFAKHYCLIWMQAVLEINFGGIQAVLE